MTIWHWLVILIVVGGVYAVYRLANRGKQPANTAEGTNTTAGPSGVGGWLLVLVAGMMFLGPLFGASRIDTDLIAAEQQYPNLLSASEWNTFKAATWWTFLGIAALSFYGGWGLARRRDWSVVRRAIVILWVIGPIASLVMGVLIPSLIFSRTGVADLEFLGGLTASTILQVSGRRTFRSQSAFVQPTLPCRNRPLNQIYWRLHCSCVSFASYAYPSRGY